MKHLHHSAVHCSFVVISLSDTAKIGRCLTTTRKNKACAACTISSMRCTWHIGINTPALRGCQSRQTLPSTSWSGVGRAMPKPTDWRFTALPIRRAHTACLLTSWIESGLIRLWKTCLVIDILLVVVCVLCSFSWIFGAWDTDSNRWFFCGKCLFTFDIAKDSWWFTCF